MSINLRNFTFLCTYCIMHRLLYHASLLCVRMLNKPVIDLSINPCTLDGCRVRHVESRQLEYDQPTLFTRQSNARNKDQKLLGHFLKIRYFTDYYIAVPLKMYWKYGRSKQILVGQMLKLVEKWPMADCYFQHCRVSSTLAYNWLSNATLPQSSTVTKLIVTHGGIYEQQALPCNLNNQRHL